MKKQIIITIAAAFMSVASFAQGKPIAAVLNVESRGIINDAQEVNFMVRLELEKSGAYNVMDKYEVSQGLQNAKVDITSCLSRACLADAGRVLKADKIVSGSVERFGEKIVISLRVVDVNSGTIERTNTTEYINLPELQKMISLSVARLLGKQSDPNLEKLLVDYDVPIESPKNTFRLNGPRMGFSGTFGDVHPVLTGNNTARGEFGMYPVNFVFGWQQEFQYISAGNFQALVENIFTITGLESQRFIPAFSPILGFRFGNGFEFGFGPNFRVVKKLSGYYDNGVWYRQYEWDTKRGPNPNQIVERIDSRGDVSLSTGLIIAVGKTFKSGYLNIPVNVYAIPRTDGATDGVMMGFNIQKKKKVE